VRTGSDGELVPPLLASNPRHDAWFLKRFSACNRDPTLNGLLGLVGLVGIDMEWFHPQDFCWLLCAGREKAPAKMEADLNRLLAG